MGGKKNMGTNSKKEAGMERKKAAEAAKQAAADREREKAVAADWAKGSNARGAQRDEAASNKAEEAARKRREKALLQAAEEEDMGNTKVKMKNAPTLSKRKNSKNKGGDLSLLEAALVGDADKKVKASKKKEREKKEREERLRLEREKKEKQSAAKNKELMLDNTQSIIGDLDDFGGRSANVAASKEINASGINAALQNLNVSSGKDDKHPEKRVKALHKEFEERMLPEMKEQYPGLRLSQYKEKIFVLWKKSPENPLNWPKTEEEKK